MRLHPCAHGAPAIEPVRVGMVSRLCAQEPEVEPSETPLLRGEQLLRPGLDVIGAGIEERFDRRRRLPQAGSRLDSITPPTGARRTKNGPQEKIGPFSPLRKSSLADLGQQHRSRPRLLEALLAEALGPGEKRELKAVEDLASYTAQCNGIA